MWRGGCIIKVKNQLPVISCGSLTFETQSVFLGDISAAYEKNSKLESLLFDDFFNKGEILYIFASRYNLPSHNSCS
jgi:6-phosphogluconate dehydrogenase